MVKSTNDAYYLSGEDAMNFINSLMNPSKEDVEHYNRVMRRIEESIRITNRREYGFDVEVKGLDLSFLNNSSEDYSFTMSSQMIIMTSD